MSGNEFKDLDIESKVNYVNTLLEQGNTVETICKNMGKGKNFIRNTLKDYGYSLNKSINQYIKDDTVVTDTTNVVKKPNKKVSKQSNEVNNINTSDDRIKVLERQIKDLQSQINIINDMLNKNNATNVVIDTTSIIHSSIDSYDRNDTKSSHYRIYTDIQEEFKAFCKEHKQYKVQDIISSAIKEYLDKYNK